MSSVFSNYVPGSSSLHRLGVGWKYLLVVVLIAPALAVSQPWLSLAALLASVVLLALSRIGLGYALRLPLGVWVLAALLAGYQLLVGAPGTAVVVAANLVAAIYASRVLTATTPATVLIDALVSVLRPLRRLGLDPELAGLAVSLMIASVPVLLDSFAEVRAAARARGRERNPLALLTPVVVRAVGRAQATGEALVARGLDQAAAPTAPAGAS